MPSLPPPRHRQGPDGRWYKPEGLAEPSDTDWWQATDDLWYPPEQGASPRVVPASSLDRDWPPLAVAGGGAVLVLSALLPWLTFSIPAHSESISGTSEAPLWIVRSGDGWVTLFLGVVLIAAGVLSRSGGALPVVRGVGVLASVAVLAWLMFVYLHVNDEYDNVIGKAAAALAASLGKDNPYSLQMSFGFWLTVAAALIALFGATRVGRPDGHRT